MKKILVLALLAAATVSAHANCKITMTRDDRISRAFQSKGGWNMEEQKFEQLCQKLHKSRAAIRAEGMAAVLSDRSIGWAALSVKDLDSAISISSYGKLETVVNTFASQDKADELLVQAINSAAMDWHDLDKALALLDAERQRLRPGPAGRPARR